MPLSRRRLALALAAPFALRGQSAEAEIRLLVAAYARSIDAADPKLASEIWSPTSPVSFIHPMGHERSLDQIKQHVYTQLMGETFSQRKLSPKDIVVHTYADTAWVEFYWDFAAKMRANGADVETHGRETQIYHKEQGRWRLVHVHYSEMPKAQ
jgi:ketosteroid isomerase-like protein